jgi:hypothetical protein
MGSGSVWVGGVCGIGGAGGAIDIRFIRRASVGLMVRAPSPVAWGGITEARFEDEEGVVAAAPAGFLIGVLTALVEDDRVWSTAPDAVKNGPGGSRGLGWNDFAFRFRTDEGTLVSSRLASGSRGRRKLLDSVRVVSVLILRALRLARLADAFVGANAPELIDLREPREAVLVPPAGWAKL